MELLLQQVLAGLANGAIYALMALAVVMIYQAIDHLNFAQGEMAMFSTFIAWQLIAWGQPYWVAFAVSVIVSFVAGILVDRVLFRLISTHEAGMIGVTLVMLGLLYLFFRGSRLGLAMRAAAANPESARLVGIRVGWMIALGWGMSAAIGAISGMLIAPVVFLEPNMMFGVLLYGFTGAVLGGLSSPGGAVAGGFAVGVIENLAGTFIPYFGRELKLTIALMLIVAVLLVRPSGVFGRAVVSRV